MGDSQRRYRAFLLRIWRERSKGEWVWRASLEDPHSNVRLGFPTLERLSAYLKEQTEDNSIEET